MRNLLRSNDEILVTEDGLVAANKLPLDKTTSEISFETATFGLG